MVRRRFDVFRNANPKTARAVPYLLLLQSDLLDELPTQVVAPLVKTTALASRGAARLNPSFDLEGEAHFMLTQQMGAVATASLSERVGSLESRCDDITAALDLLFSGI